MRTLVYYSSFAEVDVTVLKYLSQHYHVVWFPILYNNGHDVYTERELCEYALKYGIELHVVNVRWRRRSIKQLFLEWNIIKLIRTYYPDIVFTCHRDLYFVLLASLLLKHDKTIFGIHDYQRHSNFEKNIFLCFSHWLTFHLYDNFLLYSLNQKKLFQKDYPHKNSFLTYLSVKDYGKVTSSNRLSYDKIRFLFFGRIDYYKGLDLLIEACEKLVYKVGLKAFSLSICGTGKYWEKCVTLIKNASIYNLQIRFVENEEIPNLFANHHYLVLPYRDATQSGPSMIALNYGLPIIAPNIDSFKDLYSDDAAIFYEEGGLEQALHRALDIKKDDYQKMKANTLLAKDKYSEQQIADIYMNVFDKLSR